MSTITIKDAGYRVIGYIETQSDGTQIAKTVGYRIVGRYNPKSDVTMDAGYRIVARGNILAGLLR